MKKHLWIIGIAGIFIVALYSIVTHHWLATHNMLLRQDIAAGRNAAWNMIIMIFMNTPLVLWLQMNDLHEKTEGDTAKGTWERIRYGYGVIWPYKERFNLFLIQHPICLYAILVIPVLYFCILVTLIAANMFVEWVSWQWFKLSCWWDDLYLWRI